MRIAYYCQHVLGIGHFHRSLEICQALSARHQVQLVTGGPPVSGVPDTIGLFQLPGLRMDSRFQNLAPCAPGRTLEETRDERRNLLMSFFNDYRPEVFVVELYPFGRKAFRFELDPVLAAIREGTLPPCRCYVSLRDILVERPDDRDRFENRAVTTLNRFFDGLLIHSDPAIITLDETFSRVEDITIPIAYTGFVTPQVVKNSRADIRGRLQLTDKDRLIVVSIGGGNVGSELVSGAIEAFRLLPDTSPYHMQIFTGPYFEQEVFEKLSTSLPSRICLDRFTDSFPDWLQAADLSISMAGYNTCMNIVQAGVPGLVYPFAHNREQVLRATRLRQKTTIRILDPAELQAETLAGLIREMSGKPRYPTIINLNGAAASRQQIELWCGEQ